MIYTQKDKLAPGPVLTVILALVFLAGLCACGYGLFKFAAWVAQHLHWA